MFSDIMISKKKHAWRTFLIIPELSLEIQHAKANVENYRKLIAYEFLKENYDKGLINTEEAKKIYQAIIKAQEDISASMRSTSINPFFESLFRNGIHQTFFGMQVARYADIYGASVRDISQYSPSHEFTPRVMLLPHERVLGLEDVPLPL